MTSPPQPSALRAEIFPVFDDTRTATRTPSEQPSRHRSSMSCPRGLLRPLECVLRSTVPLCISLRVWQTWAPRVSVLQIVTLISFVSYRNVLSPQICPSLTTTCAAVAYGAAVLILMLLICFCAAFAKSPGFVPRSIGCTHVHNSCARARAYARTRTHHTHDLAYLPSLFVSEE